MCCLLRYNKELFILFCVCLLDACGIEKFDRQAHKRITVRKKEVPDTSSYFITEILDWLEFEYQFWFVNPNLCLFQHIIEELRKIH